MRLGLLFSLATLCAFGQTVSNIRFDGIGDSSMRVLFDVTGDFNAFRIRYGTSNTASGTGGFIQVNGTAPSTYVHFDMTGNISGLAPNTTYFVSPEVSSNGGATWSNGVSAPVTTLARTQTLPLAPVPVSTSFPPQSGGSRNVAANCSNLQAQMNAALPGETIIVPAGTVCTGPYTLPLAPGVKTFTPASVQTSDSTVTIANHGFTEGQEVRLSTAAANQGCLPGMLLVANFLNCDYGGGGWRKGNRYWVHVPDAGHIQLLDGPGGNPVIPGWLTFSCNAGADNLTFKPTWQTPSGISYPGTNSIPANTLVQFHTTGTLCGGLLLNTNYYLLTECPASAHVACTTQVSRIPGGAPVDITSAGAGVHRFVDQGKGTGYIGPAPDPNARWIVITSGGALPPPGSRTSPAFDAQGFHIRQTVPLSKSPIFAGGILSHNWRIVGAIFDTATNNDYLTTTDPRPYCGILSVNQDNENIIFDRTRVQGPGYPNRFGCSTAIFINGRNVGMINSDWRGMDYWHPWSSGFGGSFTGSSVTLTAGNANAGSSIFNSKAGNTFITVTNGGGANGTAFVYLAMDGTMRVQPPAGASLSCTNTGIACSVLPGVANPNWPVNANGRTAALKVATFNMASGMITGICAGGCVDPIGSANAAEGAQAIIAGAGPGPYIFDNNFISGTGIPLHFDDSAGPFQIRGDYTITRNTFDVPASQMATGSSSDGLRYGHRQPLEWKAGQRIKVDGNLFQGSFSESSPACVAVAVTPRSGGYVTDFDFTNNVVVGCGGLNLPVPIDSGNPVSKPAQRIRAANNVFLLNGPTSVVKGTGAPRGWTFAAGYGSEDILIDHNTVYDPRGSTPAFLYWTQSPVGGMKVTNNIFFYTGNLEAMRGENVSGCMPGAADKVLMDCAFTSGRGIPSYVFSNNVVVPSWLDSVGRTDLLRPSVVADAYPDLPKNFFPNGIDAVKFRVANYSGVYTRLDLRLATDSPYSKSSPDGTAAGANLEQLQQAQGLAAPSPTQTVPDPTPDPVPPDPGAGPVGGAGVADPGIAPTGAFQMRYAANLNIGDGSQSIIRITNSGAAASNGNIPQNGNLCANLYAFSPDEQMLSCCTCLVTPNGLASITVKSDLVSNSLTASLPNSVVIALVATRAAAANACNAASLSTNPLVAGIEAWGVTLHALPAIAGRPAGTYGVGETPFSKATLTQEQSSRFAQVCAFIQANGSGYGVCKSCDTTGLGRNQR